MVTRQIIFTTILFLFFLNITACSEKNNPPPETQIGKPPPAFNLMDLKGESYSPAKEKGNVIIIRFWSTQCKSCRDEMPKLENLFKKYRSSGMTLLAINIEDGQEKIREFIKGLSLTYPILIDENKDIAKKYQVFGVPTSFLIDKGGIIRERYFGDKEEDEVGKLISRYL